MPSPFPGVDPYIEAQDFWQDFHARFLTYACDVINLKLPAGYVAQLGEKLRLPLPIEYVEVRDTWIEIHRGRTRPIVASIEVLSPTNKTGIGRAEYLAKRWELIQRRIHLVELDLLLGGTRLPMGRSLPAGNFYALVSRAEERPQSDVYAWSLRDPIPSVPIPLSRPDGDVILELAELFSVAYDRGRYVELVDDSVPPPTVKNPFDRDWAQRTARARRR